MDFYRPGVPSWGIVRVPGNCSSHYFPGALTLVVILSNIYFYRVAFTNTHSHTLVKFYSRIPNSSEVDGIFITFELSFQSMNFLLLILRLSNRVHGQDLVQCKKM